MKVVADFELSGKRQTGDVVGINNKTVWVKAPKRIKNNDGEFEIVPYEFVSIKRHKSKHSVEVRSV